ncbi:nucleotidyltransferase domain-containing protein [Halobacillus shinanisalinarum]|uniref:Nucleotidyltransferase domain-containing protein n=1 Tax=Halobacillus shinanisalinarum TaxID=2932258 RepID=A0ABY4H0A4_9BACI|nr:nucleotidyltransferase domain-containing protein [Halobacillus shinanisalinarum]UOQ93335.1 nucleotidyltransferase domain-containing protein [Halobacillus shinanisalinarum]
MGCPANLREQILEQLKSILNEQLGKEKVRVYLFGSWAREEEKHSSDIDIAIESPSPISPFKWNKLIEQIEDSTIPYKVDVVDLHDAKEALVQQVKKEGILWEDYAND